MRPRISKILTVLALIIAGGALFLLREQNARADSVPKYLVVDMPAPATSEKLQEILNRHGTMQWELIATPRGHAGMTNEDGFLVFRRY
jgi:hypothetical protein